MPPQGQVSRQRDGLSPIPTDHRRRPGRFSGPLLRLSALFRFAAPFVTFVVLAGGHRRPIVDGWPLSLLEKNFAIYYKQ